MEVSQVNDLLKSTDRVNIAMTVKEGCVMVLFDKPVGWVGLCKRDALKLADALIERANSLPDETVH